MKKVINPKSFEKTHLYSTGGTPKSKKMTVNTTAIIDNILGCQVEIKPGKSFKTIDTIANALSQKYPWLVLKDVKSQPKAKKTVELQSEDTKEDKKEQKVADKKQEKSNEK